MNLVMCTCIQSLDYVASRLELAILSGKFRTTKHAQSSIVEYFNFFCTYQLKLVRAALSPGYGYSAPKTSNSSIFRITNLDLHQG